MRFKTLSLGLLGALALAACDSVQAPSGPPVSGTTAGPGAAPLTQQSRDNMGANSGNASAGQATITGTRSGGGESGGARPQIERTGAAPGAGVGSPTPRPLPSTGARQQGGG
ncbi:hypothetical protein E2C05_20150 [Paracraurococcus ruber]|uniref:hypothetical protein n=1 Tax=Paracraurococcus ruber TaxID=77675 RepID=UPI0010577C5F|nr:hypothetical protein [Paracraurococcus ruber]TDG28645.1 hypothetical protein E2C05_20150 [Paracraurococcus ruber]